MLHKLELAVELQLHPIGGALALAMGKNLSRGTTSKLAGTSIASEQNKRKACNISIFEIHVDIANFKYSRCGASILRSSDWILP